MWICLAIHEIIANKTFKVTNGLISQLFVVTFVHLTYIDSSHLGLSRTTYFVKIGLLVVKIQV